MLMLPMFDLPTQYASGYLIRYVLPRTLPPQLIGPLDNHLLFNGLASLGDTIIGCGHGTPDTFFGQGNQVLMNTDSIPNVKGKIVFLISCEVGEKLGPAMIEQGAKSFIGFKQDLVWILNASKVMTPWEDKTGALILKPMVDAVNTILDGKTTSEAFYGMLEQLTFNQTQTEDEIVKAALQFNADNAVMLGDPEARARRSPHFILPVPPPPLLFPVFPGTKEVSALKTRISTY